MRFGVVIATVGAALAMSGCDNDQADEAQQVVTDLIAAYEAADYEAVCELQDERVRGSIPAVAETETCPEGYQKLFDSQDKPDGPTDRPFDAFVETLQEYEVGEAVESDIEGPIAWEVPLVGPKEATSYLVEEDGQLRVTELFYTPDASSAPGDFDVP